MAKIHVVREPFNIDGVDYMRGAELTDPALIEKVRAKHPGRVISQHREAVAAAPVPDAKPAAPAAQ